MFKKKTKTKTTKLPMITNIKYDAQPQRAVDVSSFTAMQGQAMPLQQSASIQPQVETNVQMEDRIVEDGTICMSGIASKNIYLIDNRQKHQLLITKPSIVIGTDKEKADFVITENKTVSRQHAVIYIKTDRYYITDNHSTNHTYVNEVMLNPGEIKEIFPGDAIRVANESLEFVVR